MTRRWLIALITANLLVIVALVFAYPHLMVSPGPLIGAHAELATDCFACHTPWRGIAPSRCVTCHALPDIGLRTSKGVLLSKKTAKTSFHQELIEQNCVACHSDHAGPQLTEHSRKQFSHALLRTVIREKCETCHAAPQNTIHRELTIGCNQCHQPDRWKPASFEHALLTKVVLDRCENCHKGPSDTLHRQITGNCQQCHSTKGWKPATFDHDKYFVLDRDHNTSCVTCHTKNDYSRYTCYGCHEHQPDRIRRKHVEEGIANFTNCVECHRSASGEPENENRSANRRKKD
jgi:hypothetical protein